MNCKDLESALSRADRLSPEGQQHLTGCERCRELMAFLDSSVAGEPPSPAVLQQIERQIVADLQPVSPVPPARDLTAILLCIFAAVVSVGIYRKGTLALDAMSTMQSVFILGLLAISAVILAYSLAKQMVPGLRHRVSPERLPATILSSLLLAVPLLFPFLQEENFWKIALGCFLGGLSIGIPCIVPIWLVLRRGAFSSAGIGGAAAGLLAGLAGTSVAQIHCPNLDAWHVLLAHLSVSIACSIAGFLGGVIAEDLNQRTEAISR